MKFKIFVVLTLITVISLVHVIPKNVHALRPMLTLIGPTSTSARVTLAAAGAAIRNCITDVDVTSDAQYNFRVLDGGTTIYSVVVTSGGAIVRSWNENLPLCGSANTLLEMTVSNGNFFIDYSGFTGQ